MYLTVSSGIAMEIHYCMGKKAGVDFYKSEKQACSKCGMNGKKGGCCNDEHRFYKLADAHKNIINDLYFKSPVVIITPIIPSAYTLALFSNTVTSQYYTASPPYKMGAPIYLRNCVFRI